jgi:hypothetical protein
MLKLNRSIVKYYLFENKISNKDLLLIMLIFYYKKTTFYHLKSHGFKITYLKERIQEINKKIGHDFVLVDPTETKKIIRLNVEFESNYLQIPFTYKQLQKINVNDFKLVIFHLYFYNFKTNKLRLYSNSYKPIFLCSINPDINLIKSIAIKFNKLSNIV